jgi:methionyl-tRNA formyltransferase
MDWAGEVVKVWQARVIDAPELPAGTVFDLGEGRLAVACGLQALELLQVQRPGGRRAPVSVLAQGAMPQRV